MKSFNAIFGLNSRKTDPKPSKTAGDMMNDSGKRQTNAEFVLWIMRQDKKNGGRPKTSREWFEAYSHNFTMKAINTYEVARRLSDLKNKGYNTGNPIVKIEMESIYCTISHKSLSAYSAII